MTYLSVSGFFLILFWIMNCYLYDRKGLPYDFATALYTFFRWFLGLIATFCFVVGFFRLESKITDALSLKLMIVFAIYSLFKSLSFSVGVNVMVKKYQKGVWDGRKRFCLFRWYRVNESVLEVSDTYFFGVPIAASVPDIGNFHEIVFSDGYPFTRYGNITKYRKGYKTVKYSIVNKHRLKSNSYFYICSAENGGVYVGSLDKYGIFDTISRIENGEVKNSISISELSFFQGKNLVLASYFSDPKFIDWDQDRQIDKGYNCFISNNRFLIVYDKYAGLVDIFDCKTNNIIYKFDDVASFNVISYDSLHEIKLTVFFRSHDKMPFNADIS